MPIEATTTIAEGLGRIITKTENDPQIRLLEEIQHRRAARGSFESWCRLVGRVPMKHHKFIIDKLQEVADSLKKNVARYVIILISPGTAKTTYVSRLFPPWFLGYCSGYSILACSHSADFAKTNGRNARNLVDLHTNVLGFELKSDTKAADEWETTINSRYFCAGVGGQISGHRADLGIIDDYLGSQEDADSLPIRNKQWEWFVNDFFPRASGTQEENDGSIVIIANRRHEDDLVGRLLKKEDNESPIPPERWEVIRLPFFAEENDPLGRAVGEVIWPEKFDRKDVSHPEMLSKADSVRRLPSRTRAGLWQQSPRPDEGDYFKSEWLIGYKEDELPPLDSLQLYGAADFACSEEEGANKTCIGLGGWDGKLLWILPTIYWKREDTGKVVRAWLRLNMQHNVLTWRAEKGHISKSIGPFMRDIMQEEMNFLRIEEVTPSKDKPTRARAFQGLCEFGRVRFPKFATWWDQAENDLLTFPGGTEDDVIDMLAHLGAHVDRFVGVSKGRQLDLSAPKGHDGKFAMTGRQIKTIKSQSDFYKNLAALDR